MNRTTFTVLMIAIVAIALSAMWIAWRARARRDAGVLGAASEPHGELLGRFDAQYVSTTPAGEPMVRVAAPGLRYRGPAEVAVRRDGVTLAVRGERPVQLSAARITGGGSAGRRAGKAVEAGGLALLRWRDESDPPRELESSFRFSESDDQRRFISAIDEIAASGPRISANTTQEDS